MSSWKIVSDEVLLAYPECPKCRNKNQWVEASDYLPYDKELEKTNIVNVYEYDEEKGEEVEIPEKWKCTEYPNGCGNVWVDYEAKERVDKVAKKVGRERKREGILNNFQEKMDMRYKGNKKRLEELRGMSLEELKEELGGRFEFFMRG